MNDLELLEEILLSNNILEREDELFFIIPELKFEKGFDQKNSWHQYDVWEHTVKAIESCDKNFEDRLVLLLHDIGKPFSYQDDGDVRHFKGHALKSMEMSLPILERLNINYDTLLSLIGDHATKIDINNINSVNLAYYLKLLKIQKCDSSAYEKEHAMLLVNELNELQNNIKEKFNNKVK